MKLVFYFKEGRTMSDISNEKLYFIASLDSTYQYQSNKEETIRASTILKLSSLFSEHIILSDSQIVDNKGIKNLFVSDENFLDFFCESVVVGMRKGKKSFTEIVEEQIKNGMKYSSLPPSVQKQIEDKDIKNLDHLDRLYPELKFGLFLERLDEKYDSKKIIEIDYGKNLNRFPERVEEFLDNPFFMANFSNPDVKRLCDELMYLASREMELKTSSQITRSIFYSAIQKSIYPEEVKKTVKESIINRAYSENVWKDRGFNCLDHRSGEDVRFFNKVCNRNSMNDQIVKISYANVKNKMDLDGINFKFLNELHSENEDLIEKNFSSIRNSETMLNKYIDGKYPETDIKFAESTLADNIISHISLLREVIGELEDKKMGMKMHNLERVVSPIISLGGGAYSSLYLQQTLLNSAFVSLGTYVITDLILTPIKDFAIKRQKVIFNKKFKDMKESVKIDSKKSLT